MPDCQCVALPDGAVLMNVLCIVEYMDVEGEIWKLDQSHANDGDDLIMGKALELAEWAKTLTVAPMLVEMVHSHMRETADDDDDDDEEVE